MGLGDESIQKAVDNLNKITGGYKPTATPTDAKGMQGDQGITGTDRNAAQEIEAAKLGYSSDYIANRGGINAQGYWNDVALHEQLTAAEKKSVTNKNGTVDTAAMTAILQKKAVDALIAKGIDPEKARNQVQSDWYNTGTGPGTRAGETSFTGSSRSGAVGNLRSNGAGGTVTGLAVAGGPGTTEQQLARKSAYDILAEEFNRYGLGALIEPLRGLVQENVSPSEFSLRLQQTDAYKQRFSGNADRISKGLTALRPAEYLAMEDQYQNIMRNYGLPASYYAKDSIGTQSGFNQLIANDVSATELEDRIMTAQNRVINANPEVTKALKAFYPDITNGDILAYTLDPTKALDMIKRKVTAAEIGGAALAQGLSTSAQSAEDLARYGINKAQAQQGYENIAGMLPRASDLSSIYKQDPYTQAVAEADVFGTAGSAAAANKRKKLTALETASFSGSSGAAGNALSRDRSSSQMQYRESGAGAF
jgi:hypothetical protein